MLEEDLLQIYLTETQDHLATIESNLLSLESDPTHSETINSLFRAIHSIKGGAGVFGFNNLGQLGHSMENLISKARESELQLSKKHIDALLHGMDALRYMNNDISKIEDVDVTELVNLFESFIDPSQLNGVKAESPESTIVEIQPESTEDIDLSQGLRKEIDDMAILFDQLLDLEIPKPEDIAKIIDRLKVIQSLLTKESYPNIHTLIAEFIICLIKWQESPSPITEKIKTVIEFILDYFFMLGDDLSHSESADSTDFLEHINILYSELNLPDSENDLIASLPETTGYPGASFNVSTEELEHAFDSGMDMYAVEAYLNRDIMEKNKTPFEFILELEDQGLFIGSYLDEMEEKSPDNKLENDLKFVFIYGSIIDSAITAKSLELNPNQIRLITREELETVQEKIGISDEKQNQIDSRETPVIDSQSGDVEEVDAAISEEQSKSELKSLVPSPQTKPVKATKTEPIQQIKVDESIRVGVGKLNKLVDLAGELVLVRNQLLQTCMERAKSLPKFMTMLLDLNVITTDLQEDILNTRMQPISTVFGKFPRLIRELGSRLGKDIQLQTEGNEVELDKTVLEALSDPLTHIIRNTADHGIELPEDRTKKGKPPQGKLLLKAFHASGQVIIQVEDDGAGIDPQRIAEIGFQKGLISQDAIAKMNDQEKINLIFMPGFSTAQKVSSVSGRGVGMDVVKSNIEKIGGSVNLSSVYGVGTTIKMTLPLTMAIVSSLIVDAEGEKFAIPQVNLDELVMLQPEECLDMLGFIQEREVLRLRGELLPLISLSEVLKITPTKQSIRNLVDTIRTRKKAELQTEAETGEENPDEDQNVVRILIVSASNTKIGIIIDSIFGNEEIVVKPMPEYLKDIKSFSGATILGNGSVAMIIDIMGLMEENELNSIAQTSNESFLQKAKQTNETEKQSILIFDNGSNEQFAITISLIRRVDKIASNQIQNIGDKEYIEYRNSQVRLLRLHDFLPIKKPTTTPDIVSVVFPKDTKTPIAILINQIVDTQVIESVLSEGTIQKKGILGSILIDGKITLLLDLFAILEMGEPDSVLKIYFSPEQAKKIKILLVEDTPLFQTMIREYLRSVGFQVTLAENGQQGFECLQRDNYDIVLSDIEMPVLDGFGLIKKIRANSQWNQLPVVAVTTLNDEKTVKSGLDAGFTDWMIKLDKPKILNAIRKFVRP